MPLYPDEMVLDDSTSNDVFFDRRFARGAVPRDYKIQPVEMFSPPSEMPLIPRSEWSARIKEMEETKSRVSDILLAAGYPSLDQGQVGYCWGHSTVGCVQAVRAIANQPKVLLSAYAVCSIIKKGRDEGGWGALSAEWVTKNGVPSVALWPQGDRSLNHDTPAMRADAARNRITEDWMDLTRDVYDRNLNFDQAMSCLLSRQPVVGDWNWWSHSTMCCDPVEVEPGSFGIRIRNSWGDGWGDKGFSVLRGSKAIPDGALSIRVVIGA